MTGHHFEDLWREGPDPPGYDLLGAFVGSEGTLGIATEVTVRLVRKPETIVTLLAAFESIDLAGTAVSAVIASGVLPSGDRDDGRIGEIEEPSRSRCMRTTRRREPSC